MSYSRDSSYGRGRGRSYGGGDGIARVQGFVIFVKNGKVGQKVKVKVEQIGDRFATATISNLV